MKFTELSELFGTFCKGFKSGNNLAFNCLLPQYHSAFKTRVTKNKQKTNKQTKTSYMLWMYAFEISIVSLLTGPIYFLETLLFNGFFYSVSAFFVPSMGLTVMIFSIHPVTLKQQRWLPDVYNIRWIIRKRPIVQIHWIYGMPPWNAS